MTSRKDWRIDRIVPTFPAMPQDYMEAFERDGFAVVRGVFTPDEIAELADAFDRVYAAGMKHRSSFRHGNVFYRLSNDPGRGKTLRLVQWPSYFEPVLDRFRRDLRMHDILAPFLGGDLKQIINQMHWKIPGAAQTSFGYHQDIWFRRPKSAYRDPAHSYVQTGIAVDAHTIENGAMMFCPGSHRCGEIAIDGDGTVMDRPLDGDGLRQAGIDPASAMPLLMQPGDVALWNLYAVHGSGPNGSAGDRRLYINGYVTAANCDRGEWTFRNGRPMPLGEPVLVHYEELYTRPEPHYPDEPGTPDAMARRVTRTRP